MASRHLQLKRPICNQSYEINLVEMEWKTINKMLITKHSESFNVWMDLHMNKHYD